MGDAALAAAARAGAERTRAAVESTYWLPDASMLRVRDRRGRAPTPPVAEPGPERERRQQRLERARERAARRRGHGAARGADVVAHARSRRAPTPQLDRLGSGAMATDWGHRILSDRSALYDPLSYHYGSVWPLFTGWASMAAYRYGRPHVGYQALMANALLTEPGALGYVTELLSGDLNAAFGRSSHHQVWSEAMVVTPLVRGLLGIEPLDGGARLRIAPQLPADWDRVSVQRIVARGWTRRRRDHARRRGADDRDQPGTTQRRPRRWSCRRRCRSMREIDRVIVDGRHGQGRRDPDRRRAVRGGHDRRSRRAARRRIPLSRRQRRLRAERVRPTRARAAKAFASCARARMRGRCGCSSKGAAAAATISSCGHRGSPARSRARRSCARADAIPSSASGSMDRTANTPTRSRGGSPVVSLMLRWTPSIESAGGV